jgi:hypothetical protein
MTIFDDISQQIATVQKERVLVEAFGTPGVGKSYICLTFQESYSTSHGSIHYHSIDAYSANFIARLFCKIFYIIKYLRFEVGIIKANFMILRCFKNIKISVKSKLILNLLLVSSLAVSNRKGEVPLLIDQGIAQTIWSLFYYNEGDIDSISTNRLINSIYYLFKNLCLDELVVLHINAEKSVIYNRLSTRNIMGSSPLNSLDESALKKGDQATFKSRNIIEEVIKKSKKISIFDVDN